MKIYSSRLSKKAKKKAGFTLAELLIVVIIIGILAAFTGVAAVSMYRNMKQSQLDKTAETIFHAAQNRLSEIYAYGKEDSIGKDENTDLGIINPDNNVFYISKDSKGKDASKLIIGNDVVSADIYNNLWVIEYQASTCRVLNVVYADKDGLGGFGKGINAENAIGVLEDAVENGKFSSSERKNKYGWYGDGTATNLAQGKKKVGNTSASVEIINEERLYAHMSVSIPNNDELKGDVSFKVSIKNAKAGDTTKPVVLATVESGISEVKLSGTERFFNLATETTGSGDDAVITYNFDYLLDSADGTGLDRVPHNETFKTLVANSVVPYGSDFYLILEVYGKEGNVTEVLDYDVDNSLFAGTKKNGEDGNTAYIQYGRHLQNLNLTTLSNVSAIQIADLDFSKTGSGNIDEIHKCWASVYEAKAYVPGNCEKLISYDGQKYVIKKLEIAKATNPDSENKTYSGIFGYLSNIKAIDNVIITDSSVNASAASEAVGLFAAKTSASAEVKINNCLMNGCKVEGNSTNVAGGFIGSIASPVAAEDITLIATEIGGTATPKDGGIFAGEILRAVKTTNLQIIGGSVKASADAGAIAGHVTSAGNVEVKKTNLTAVSITSDGIAGGAIGLSDAINLKLLGVNSLSSTVKATAGAAGGLIGKATTAVDIQESSSYIPSTYTDAIATIDGEYAERLKLITTPSDVPVDITYDQLAAKLSVEFKLLDALKTEAAGDISKIQLITGAGNVGGLVGESSAAVTVKRSFAAGVIGAATGNAGGFVGSSGKLDVAESYADFYIQGTTVGGFAGVCGADSVFDSCYTAGFLYGTATSAGGFTPGDVSRVSNSYTVFNFDNVFDGALFTGESAIAVEDPDHQLNVNGTVTNYPEIEDHEYYPLVKSTSDTSGKGYYVYSGTTFEETDNIVQVKAQSLHENKDDNGIALLTGSFVGAASTTVPYNLAPFFNGTLSTYPFPALNVSIDGASTELAHYNDWLVLDANPEYEVEIWYMMYNSDLTKLDKNVEGFNGEGIRLAGTTEAVEVDVNGNTEYQLNVGKRDDFSGYGDKGYTFVGYFDPDAASAPLIEGNPRTFDRGQKLDYIAADSTTLASSIKSRMQAGDKVVQTSINAVNEYGFVGTRHGSILEESTTNTYGQTKRIYAVYREKATYVVTLSCVEFYLPDTDATTETESLESIYNGDFIGVGRREYQEIYVEANRPSTLAADEEYTYDYLAERIIERDYPDAATRNQKLEELRNDRINANRKIEETVPKITGYETYDPDALRAGGFITPEYYNFVNNMPVYKIVQIDPDTKDANGNDREYKDRCKKVEATGANNDQLLLTTEKAYSYVILYTSTDAKSKLNIVFEDTNVSSTKTTFSSYSELSGLLADSTYDGGNDWRIRVAQSGFKDTYQLLDELMDESGYPEFKGFVLSDTNVDTSGDAKNVTLTYTRKKYSLSFQLKPNDDTYDVTPLYNNKDNRTAEAVYYGDYYETYLWEIGTAYSERDVDIDWYHGYSEESVSETELYYANGNRGTPDKNASSFTLSGLKEELKKKSSGNGRIFIKDPNNNKKYIAIANWEIIVTNYDGTDSFAFKRKGFFLSGFKYYYEDERGDYSYDGETYAYAGETTSSLDVLKMPACNVLAVAQWTNVPKELRVEVYYQSRYDKLESTDDIKYEYFDGTTINLTNGTATIGNNTFVAERLMANAEDVFAYMDQFVLFGNKANNAIPTEDLHVVDKAYTYRYNKNVASTRRYGAPRINSAGTLVVGLYYDRAVMEYWFHYLSQKYTFSTGWFFTTTYNVENQWTALLAGNNIYNKYTDYDGYQYENVPDEAKPYYNFRKSLQSVDGTWRPLGDYMEVMCSSAEIAPTDRTSMQYGGNTNGGSYSTSDDLDSNPRFNRSIVYRALYGAPAYISTDHTNVVPEWNYKYQNDTITLTQYSRRGTQTIYGAYDIQYFIDSKTEATTVRRTDTGATALDFYPYYASGRYGYNVFYNEAAPADGTTLTGLRTDPDQDVELSMFDQKNPFMTNFSGGSYTLYLANTVDGQLVEENYLDGYEFYGFSSDNNNLTLEAIKNLNKTSLQHYSIPSNGTTGNALNHYVFYKRKTYHIVFEDSYLPAKDYLYKQFITQLDKPEVCPYGDGYDFDGWYTASVGGSRITDDTGKVLDEYVALDTTPKALDTSDNKMKMIMDAKSKNMKVFARWLPKNCNITFYPIYPDIPEYGADTRLWDNSVTVRRGSTIDTLPAPMAPDGTSYSNREVISDATGVYYIVQNNAGAEVARYRFDGWYSYANLDTPSQEDLVEDNHFIAGVTVVKDNTKLFAKWTQVSGNATYTIKCIDIATNEVILEFQRTGLGGTRITVAPPNSGSALNDDIIVSGSFADLGAYEPLTGALTETISNGLTLRFKYRAATTWSYNVNSYITVGTTDVCVSTYSGTTSYMQVLVKPNALIGYTIADYVVDGVAQPKNDYEYVAITRPSGTDHKDVTFHYTFNASAGLAGNPMTYYKYDRLNLVNYNANSFNWPSGNYVPAITYTIGGNTTYEFIGSAADDAISKAADSLFSGNTIPVGDYNVQFSLDVYDKSSGAPVKLGTLRDLGAATVGVRDASYEITFNDATDIGKIYYAFAGSHAGSWYWDKELTAAIGPDGTNIIGADISALDATIAANAQAVKNVISRTDTGSGYKKFYILKGTDTAYVIVDETGTLRNGARLQNGGTALIESNAGVTYTIKLYKADGSSETITIILR